VADVTFEQVSCWYDGAPAPAIHEMDLSITDGELFVFCGAPESGKSTLLRMLAGLVPVTSGRILVGGRDIAGDDPPEVALVFQNYALYPHLTVERNIAIPLLHSHFSKRTVAARVAEAASHLVLTDVLGRPAEGLSAGQRIRVALARGLVREPAVMLMDDPLGNLQPGIRAEVAEMLVTAQRRHRTTTVYASPDADEALTLGDRVAVIDEGVLHEVAVPSDIEPGGGQRTSVVPSQGAGARLGVG
jgi:ABC-type sugar transport system ATPase subunit